MKLGKILFSLLLVLILSMSISAIAAEDNVTNDNAVQYTGNVYVVKHNDTLETIQKTINNAKSGDTIKFEANGVWGSNETPANFQVSTGIIFQGNNATIYGGDITAIFNVKANATTDISGASFYNFNFKMIGKTQWNGRGIQFNTGSNSHVINCTFANGNAGLYISGSKNITIENCYFTGTTNWTSIGKKKESGTKAINAMSCQSLIIKNNIFYGELLDGVSIASNSKAVIVYNNEFYNNTYSIFFGGGSNGTIMNNLFYNIKLNAINMAKASQLILISFNEFKCKDDVNQIYLEQGNTAHGAPTNIGYIYILSNSFSAINDANRVNVVYVYSNGGPLKVNGQFLIDENTMEAGMNLFTFFDADWGEKGGETINITPEVTYELTGEDVVLYYGGDVNYIVTLSDSTGKLLAGEIIEISVAGETYAVTTDAKGQAMLSLKNLDKGNYTIAAIYKYDEDEKILNSINKVTVKSTIESNDIVKMFHNDTQYYATFFDSNGNVLANQNVEFTINGVKYTRTTDALGKAKMTINLNAGEYSIYTINPVTGESIFNKITVLPILKMSDLTKVYGQAGSLEVTAYDEKGNPIANQEITININGVFYTKTTDASGIAKLNINLLPGEYIATAMWNGFQTSAKVTVKEA